MTKKEKVSIELKRFVEKMNKNHSLMGKVSFEELEGHIEGTREEKELIRNLMEMKVTTSWLIENGFLNAALLLDL